MHVWDYLALAVGHVRIVCVSFDVRDSIRGRFFSCGTIFMDFFFLMRLFVWGSFHIRIYSYGVLFIWDYIRGEILFIWDYSWGFFFSCGSLFVGKFFLYGTLLV